MGKDPARASTPAVRRARLAADGPARSALLAADVLVTVESVENLVVLRTLPGAAAFLASAIDLSPAVGSLGAVAGNDTILVVTRDRAHAAEFVASVHERLVRGRLDRPGSEGPGVSDVGPAP